MPKSSATLPAPDTEERPAEIGSHADVPEPISNQYDSFVNPMIGRVGAAFRERGHRPTYEHAANSAATFAHPETRGHLVRPGGVLYGLWRDVLPPLADAPSLRPVMSVRTRITLLKRVHAGETLGYGCTFKAAREMMVATVPVGYADGYARALSNRGRVIVRGSYASVIGRISMDLTLVDVTGIPDVNVADEVVLLGSEDGLNVDAREHAELAHTIPYEILCGISKRVPRKYSS